MARGVAASFVAYLTFFLLSCPVRYTGCDESNNTEKIHLLSLLPYPNSSPLFSPSFAEGLNIIPALDLAVRHVNEKEGFLEGYELELIHRDGGCEIQTTTSTGLVTGLFVNSDEQKAIGIIGPGCSASAITVLSTIHTDKRTSYIAVHGAGSPSVDRKSSPNSFGVLGSAAVFVDAIFRIMQESSWRKLAVFVDPRRPFFSEIAGSFQAGLTTVYPDASVLFSIVVYDFFIPLNQLRDSFARITFVFASVDLSQRIMCLALRSGMVYPDYQWVLVGRAIEEFPNETITFIYNDENYNCSAGEFSNAALNGTFLLNYNLISFEEDEPNDIGLSYTEFLAEYKSSVTRHNLESNNNSIEVSIWATYFYDAVWAWAIVLDNVTKSGNFSVKEYQFNQPNDALIEQFELVDFEGVSGHIEFDKETGSVNRFIDIFQVFNGTAQYSGYFNAGTIVKMVDGIEFVEDSFPVDTITIHPASALFVVPLLIITVFTIAAQVVAVIHRDFKSIKASSPRINHLAYVGVYLLVIGFAVATVSYAFYLEGKEAVLCQVSWAFLFPYGLTLAFGAVGAKTWRLYRIFIHYLNPGKFISEPFLFTIVFMLLSIDVVMSIVWTTVDPFVLRRDLDTSNSEGPIVRQRCFCDYYFVWFGIIVGYHLLQLAVLVLLAALTRKITNKSFQTVTLQVLTYGTIIVFGLGATLYYFSVFRRLNIHIVFLALGIIITLLALLYLLCVFLPPIIPLLKYKLKERGYHFEFSFKTRKTSMISQEIFF